MVNGGGTPGVGSARGQISSTLSFTRLFYKGVNGIVPGLFKGYLTIFVYGIILFWTASSEKIAAVRARLEGTNLL